MRVKLTGGRVYDPAHGINGKVQDIYVEDGVIIPAPQTAVSFDAVYDLSGKIVMAGAIDMHTHIGGGKVNIARAMLPEDHRARHADGSDTGSFCCSEVAPSTLTTGHRYIEMGYTTCFEPAVLPVNARQAHMEMGDIPIIDTGGYAMLGNDDFLLQLIHEGADQSLINDYVAWTLDATQCIGIKVVNPGGISAFKFNQRKLDLDETAPYYEITPRKILKTLTQALHDLGVPHPLHVHTSNLGVPGNVQTTLETMTAAEGLPMHLTHIQFHSYGTEGDLHFSSGAAQIAEAINKHSNITADVGQIMFGQTVTASGDTMSQHRNRKLASPGKWMCMDIECDAGCGIVPFRYRDQNYVNALQWAIGLEIFLMVNDPWRIFLTTDHPNGGPFTSYPHLIRLLMDKSFRNDMLAGIHPGAAANSHLPALDREYSLYEIAILTRAGPARVLGLHDRGHLGPGATADIVVYTDQPDREKMFSRPDLVFKDGQLIVHEGRIVQETRGATHTVKPEYDRGIERRLQRHFDRYMTTRLENFRIDADELCECGSSKLIIHPCKSKK